MSGKQSEDRNQKSWSQSEFLVGVDVEPIPQALPLGCEVGGAEEEVSTFPEITCGCGQGDTWRGEEGSLPGLDEQLGGNQRKLD